MGIFLYGSFFSVQPSLADHPIPIVYGRVHVHDRDYAEPDSVPPSPDDDAARLLFSYRRKGGGELVAAFYIRDHHARFFMGQVFWIGGGARFDRLLRLRRIRAARVVFRDWLYTFRPAFFPVLLRLHCFAVFGNRDRRRYIEQKPLAGAHVRGEHLVLLYSRMADDTHLGSKLFALYMDQANPANRHLPQSGRVCTDFLGSQNGGRLHLWSGIL